MKGSILNFMKYKVLIPSAIVAILIAFFSFKIMDTFGSNAKNQHEIIMKTVMKIIESGHYNPKEMNDSFSLQVYEKTIESLDFEKKFFLQSDIDQLSKHKFDIDDQLKRNDISFFNEISSIFTKRLAQADQFYHTALKGNFDFSTNEQYETDAEKLAFVKDEAAMQKRWNTNMKYRVLAKYFELKKAQEKKLEKKEKIEGGVLTAAQLKAKAVESTLKTQDRYFKRLKKFNDNDRFAIFMNSITGSNDPHTTFLQPQDKKRFDEMMSGNFIGIGATLLQQDDGRVKITSIITGSPSWKQGQLKAEDLIEKVGQGDETPVEVDGFDIEDIIKMIRGKEGTVVSLTVAKPDGSKQVIPIIRGKVDIDNIYAKSAIVEEKGKRIGYIILPEFYSNFNGDKDGRKSSTDIEKEVIKLMNEKVDGIILDLRNNGGGSLTDVVDIVGLFVGSGPVVQVRSSGDKIMTLRSRRAKALYDGPLAIMINNGSASASEILAAAIQDYERGIVIGTKSFGKGTVQKLVILDQFVSGADRNTILNQLKADKGGDADFDGVGSLKITIQKFYRINGGSTQLRGVEPDILLPDAFELIDEMGEKRDKNALAWDKIEAAEYSLYSSHQGLNELIKASNSRVNKSPSFKLISETAVKLKERKDNTIMPMNEKAFEQKMKENEALSKKVEQLDSMKVGIQVVNLKEDLAQATIDEVAKENNEKWLKGLRKDPFVNETANIVEDMINKGISNAKN